MTRKQDKIGEPFSQPSILLLVPEMYTAHGGVQVYMRRLAEILFGYGLGRGRLLDCVSLTDSEFREEQHFQQVIYNAFVGTRGSKPAFSWRTIQVAWKHKPQIAVIGHIGLVPIGWCLKLLGLIRSYVLVLHGTEAWQKVDTLDRLAAKRAARIVSTTRYTAKEFSRCNGIPLQRFHIIPLATTDSPAGGLSSGRVESKGGLNVLTVSRLTRYTRYKGIDTLIDALARARAANAAVRLTIVGDGDDLPWLRNQVAELGLGGQVLFRGAVSDRELANLYRECDVFAMPSKGEGFGIVFLEAMRYGKPCIGGNHGGTPEVIDDQSDGFLVEHGDVDRLTQSLLELAGNPGLRIVMGERARRKVEKKFLFPRMRDDWYSLLSEILLTPKERDDTDQRSVPVQAGTSVRC
jgi:glycosyltransferase involved in cell wall biosynthesis